MLGNVVHGFNNFKKFENNELFYSFLTLKIKMLKITYCSYFWQW